MPGIGKILRLGLRDDIHRIDRFPSGQEFASYDRLVKCRTASAGKRWGTAGANIGNPHLPWAFADAAVLVLRNHPHGQKLLARWENTHDQGTALTMLAHKLARAVYSMRTRQTAVAMDLFLRSYGSAAGAPDASLDTQRDEPEVSVRQSYGTASWNATVRLCPVSLSLTR